MDFGALFSTGVGGLKCYACNYTNVVPWYMPFCKDSFDDKSVEAASAVVTCPGGVCIVSMTTRVTYVIRIWLNPLSEPSNGAPMGVLHGVANLPSHIFDRLVSQRKDRTKL